MSENFTHSIELIEGYKTTDPATGQEIKHTTVTFGRRVTAKDLMSLDNDPQSANQTQYNDLIRRKMITKFGTLKMPVALNVLLSLDSIDRDDLAFAADRFLRESRGERTFEYLDNHTVKLPFGFDIDGTIYNVVRFGNRITGRDNVEADGYGNGVTRLCFTIGKQIAEISTEDNTASIKGTVELEHFDSLDSEDITILQVGSELWRQSFRHKRKAVSPERNGGDSVSAGA